MAEKRTNITVETFKHLPWWTWVFIVVCVAVPISTLGGAIPAAIAVLGIILCVRFSIQPSNKLPVKIALCTLIAAIAWGVAWISVFFFQQL